MIRLRFVDGDGGPIRDAVLAITESPGEMTDLGYVTDEQGAIALTLDQPGAYGFTLTDATGQVRHARGVLPVDGSHTPTAD